MSSMPTTVLATDPHQTWQRAIDKTRALIEARQQTMTPDVPVRDRLRIQYEIDELHRALGYYTSRQAAL